MVDQLAVLSRRRFAAAAAAMALLCLCLTPSPALAFSPCCADLEARIAELETLSVRKGSRNLSLRIYGQVNRAVMAWDDGVESNAYVVDNETSTTRIGLIGQSQIRAGVAAGYRIELEFASSASDEVSASDATGSAFAAHGSTRIRHSYFYVSSQSLGQVSLGQQSPATDDITLINLGSRMGDAALHYNNNFQLRIPSPGVFDLTWGDLAHTVDSFRGAFVRYDTPTIAGFLVSTAWGEDDVWDAALRYAGELGPLRIAAGIGYMDNRQLEFSDVRGSASALHTSSGLYVSIAGGLRDDDGVALDTERNGHFYFAQIGRTARYLPFGDTTFYGEYGNYVDFSVGKAFEANLTGTAIRRWAITDAEVERWGVGVEQSIDAAGLLLYGQFHNYSAGFSGARCAVLPGAACTPDGTTRTFQAEDWRAFVVGARIQF